MRLDIRIPISPTEKYLRMTIFFLESLRMYSGDIGKKANCTISVSPERPEPGFDRYKHLLNDYSVDLRWVDKELFDVFGYDATGFDRFFVKSDADVVLMMDADMLFAGDFDQIIDLAYQSQTLLGFIAHVSPFCAQELKHIPSYQWWKWIFGEAGLSGPDMDWTHTGWGLMNRDPLHRRCPQYYNFGFIAGPAAYMDAIGTTFIRDLHAVDSVVETWFKSQIALTLAIVRHNVPCHSVSINYNFPLHVSEQEIRELNPDPSGKNSSKDIRIFHYLGEGEISKRDFETTSALRAILNKEEVSKAARFFQKKAKPILELQQFASYL